MNDKSDRKPVSFSKGSNRSKRRKLINFKNTRKKTAGKDDRYQARLLLRWLKSSETKPMLKFLQGSSDADNLVQVTMNPDKYGK